MKSKIWLLIIGIINLVLGAIFIVTSAIGIYINGHIATGEADIEQFEEIFGALVIKFFRVAPIFALVFGTLFILLGVGCLVFYAKTKRKILEE